MVALGQITVRHYSRESDDVFGRDRILFQTLELCSTEAIKDSILASNTHFQLWKWHTSLPNCLVRCIARTPENTLRQLMHWHTKRTGFCFYDSPTSNGKKSWVKRPLIFMSALEERATKSFSLPFFIFPFTARGLEWGDFADSWPSQAKTCSWSLLVLTLPS